MSQSEKGRESFIILAAKEDTVVVETSVTKTTHIYLLSAFFHGAQNPINCSLSDRRINANSSIMCSL